ncbi:hypothetical protein [Thalassolituus sp.]|uniref:hypothetical protein n=1 Tax=Thalassolituus sp. TaxID=2030822 RepID=UPI002A81AB49|nr:hypothetical protein [Thalassolituus sp.]
MSGLCSKLSLNSLHLGTVAAQWLDVLMDKVTFELSSRISSSWLAATLNRSGVVVIYQLVKLFWLSVANGGLGYAGGLFAATGCNSVADNTWFN